MKIAIGVFAVAVLVVIVIYDVASTPAPQKGQCLLAKRVLLPNVCVNTCSPPFDCTSSTRPYLFFFTQAATCADGVLCAAARHVQHLSPLRTLN